MTINNFTYIFCEYVQIHHFAKIIQSYQTMDGIFLGTEVDDFS